MDKRSIEQLLNAITDLLEKLEKQEMKPKDEWPKEFKTQMETLSDWANLLNTISAKTLMTVQVSDTDLKKMQNPNQNQASSEDQKLLKKIEALQKKVKEKKDQNSIALAKAVYQEKKEGKGGKEAQKRKKRFFKGGKEHWKPL
jgi:protein subunit release factor A